MPHDHDGHEAVGGPCGRRHLGVMRDPRHVAAQHEEERVLDDQPLRMAVGARRRGAPYGNCRGAELGTKLVVGTRLVAAEPQLLPLLEPECRRRGMSAAAKAWSKRRTRPALCGERR